MVNSVEKAFRVLAAFGRQYQTLNRSQVATETGMDVSAAQRFTHTLTKLGYLRKDAQTKHFELTAKTLDLGYHFVRSSRLLERAMPYLMHLSKETEETVNLTVSEETEIIFVSRFLSRHLLNTDIITGTRMPAYCTAPGIAMLSRLPEDEAMTVIDASDRQAHTPSTTWEREALREKLRQSAAQGLQCFKGRGRCLNRFDPNDPRLLHRSILLQFMLHCNICRASQAVIALHAALGDTTGHPAPL